MCSSADSLNTHGGVRTSGQGNGEKRADEIAHGIFGFQDEHGVYVRSGGGKEKKGTSTKGQECRAGMGYE